MLDVFLHADRAAQFSLIEALDPATAQTLWAEVFSYLQGADNLAPVRGLRIHRRRQVFRHLVEVQDETGSSSRKTVAAFFGISEGHLREIEAEGSAGRWPPLEDTKIDVDSEVLVRLVAATDPAEDTNQDSELAERLTQEALAKVRRERALYEHETRRRNESCGTEQPTSKPSRSPKRLRRRWRGCWERPRGNWRGFLARNPKAN